MTALLILLGLLIPLAYLYGCYVGIKVTKAKAQAHMESVIADFLVV